ncbi:thioesterase superfamily protein [Thozetella sp. PMI_491]|nr:thioesterase superfamily protein [Thozetella sp. PMI_491]
MEEDLGAVRARLSTVPWVARLLSAPNQTTQVLPSRILRTDGQDLFFSKTLRGQDTISAFLMVHEEPASPRELLRELKGVFHVGRDLNGFTDILHGGAVMCIMDELMGSLTVANIERGALPVAQYLTAYLKTTFKEPIKTPGTYLGVARLNRVEGRKFYLSQSIEDGEGKVLATAEAMWVKAREKL